MWAMMPMLRTRSSGTRFIAVDKSDLLTSQQERAPAGARITSTENAIPCGLNRWGYALPAVVRKRLIRLGHAVDVVFPLEGPTLRTQRVQQFVGQALAHLLLTALPRE